MLVASFSFAQVGIGTESPDASAVLDVVSTDQGILPPRLNDTEVEAINLPAAGLIVFNTTQNCLQVNAGLPAAPNWLCLGGSKERGKLYYKSGISVTSQNIGNTDTNAAIHDNGADIFNTLGVTQISNNKFNIPEEGIYRIDFMFEGRSDSASSNSGMNLKIFVSGDANQVLDERVLGTGSTWCQLYQNSVFLELNSGDLLRFRLDTSAGASTEVRNQRIAITKIK